MENHVWIAARVRWILEALDRSDVQHIEWLIGGLVSTFTHHVRVEETGLFHELVGAGQGAAVAERLTAEHRQIQSALVSCDVSAPEQLRDVLAVLVRHNRLEDEELFPYAMQTLPNDCWDRVESVHQRSLTA